MRLIARFVFAVLGNTLALLLASRIVPGFIFTQELREMLITALILAVLSFFVKPILKLILSPVIILTLSFGLIIVNAIILVLLDKISDGITIQNIPALIYTTLIVSTVNFVLHRGTAK